MHPGSGWRSARSRSRPQWLRLNRCGRPRFTTTTIIIITARARSTRSTTSTTTPSQLRSLRERPNAGFRSAERDGRRRSRHRVLVAGEDASTSGQGVPRRLPPRAVPHPRSRLCTRHTHSARDEVEVAREHAVESARSPSCLIATRPPRPHAARASHGADRRPRRSPSPGRRRRRRCRFPAPTRGRLPGSRPAAPR